MRRRPSLRSLARGAHLPRVLVVYVSAAVGVLQTVDVLEDRLGLPDWCFPTTLTLLLVGLPVVIATALVQAAHGRWQGVPSSPRPSDGGTGVPANASSTDESQSVGAGAREDGGGPPGPGDRVAGGRRARVLTWRNVALAGATAFGLLAFSTAGYMGLRVAGIGPAGTLLGKGVLKARDRVVLADVANRTPDPQLGAVVTEALRTQLEQSKSVSVVPAADVRATLARMEQDSAAVLTEARAREVAQRLGAKAVVTGEIGAAGNGYLLSAHVLATDTTAPLVSVLETAAEPGALIAAIDRLSGKVRERIGDSLRSIRASPPLAQVTTSSLQALRLYSEASKLLSRNPAEPERPLALLQTAVALDTGFASAYRAMGVALINGGFEYARGMAMLRHALARSDRLPLAERYRAQALYDWNRGAYEPSAAAYRALLELNPTDAGALNNLGGTYADRGEYARADSLFRRALSLDSGMSVAAFNHGMALLALRQYDSARAFLRSYFGARLDAPSLYPHAALIAATEPPESLLALATRARAGAQDAQAAAFTTVVEITALWASGRLREADARSVAFDASLSARGLHAPALGAALARARVQAAVPGRTAAAGHLVDSALARHTVAAMAPDDRPYPTLAYTLALVGRPAEARHTLADYHVVLRSGDVLPDLATEQLANGAIALAEGRPAKAATDFRQAHELPVPQTIGGCRACATIMLARAFEALGRPDSAIVVYERFLERPDADRFWTLAALAPAHERLTELYAAQGDRNRAGLHGAAFLRLWAHADPELQPRVAAVRRQLEALGSDRPR